MIAAGASYARTVRGLSRDVHLLFLSKALFWLGSFGAFVLFNLYIRRLGFGPEFVGLANGVGLIGEAAVALPASELGRRLGTRRVMIWAMSLTEVCFTLLILTWLLPRQAQAPWLLATNFAASLALATVLVNMTPFLMDRTSTEECNHAFSVLTAITTAMACLGAFVGGLLPAAVAPMLSASLEEAAPYGLSMLLANSLLIPATLVLLATRREQQPGGATCERDEEPSAARPILPLRAVLLPITAMAGAVLVRTMGDGTANVFFTLYLDDALKVPTSLVGTLAALGQVLGVPAALLTPLLVRRWGNARTYTLAVLGVAAALVPVALVPRWPAAALGYVAAITLLAVAMPAGIVYQQSLVPREWRPAMSGATSMAFTGGWAVISFGGGYLVSGAGYRALYLVGATLVALGALIFAIYAGKRARHRGTEDTET